MRKFVPLLLLALLQLCMSAQDKSFTVMAVQGNVSVGGKNIAIGQQISGDAALTVNDASYIGLLHKSGNPLEFKTKGTYQLKSYSDKLASSSKGFQQKYMDYVVTGMTKKSDNTSYQKNMGVTGSVDRALARNEIIVPLPEKVTLLGKTMSFEWMDEARTPEYKVVVKNMKEEEILHMTTTNKMATLELGGVELEPEQYYLVMVTSMDGTRKSNVVNVYVPSASEKEVLMAEMEAITSSLDMSSSVGLMAYAQICEQKGLYLDAYNSYKKARELSPDVDYFKSAYKEFVDDIVAQL